MGILLGLAGDRSALEILNGKPFSPACLLEALESEKSTRFVRQMAYEELVIRYDLYVFGHARDAAGARIGVAFGSDKRRTF